MYLLVSTRHFEQKNTRTEGEKTLKNIHQRQFPSPKKVKILGKNATPPICLEQALACTERSKIQKIIICNEGINDHSLIKSFSLAEEVGLVCGGVV